MDKLPMGMVHNILEFSGHGTMRNGYRRDDGSFKPCKFISKLEPKRILALPFIKPIKDGHVVLIIPIQNHLDNYIQLWADIPLSSYERVGHLQWRKIQHRPSRFSRYGIIRDNIGLSWGLLPVSKEGKI